MQAAVRRAALRGFLLEARARQQPDDAGLPRLSRRRVPGLRREEVAELAGISTAWYTLLETGRDIRVSPRALDRIAAALRLSEPDKRQLFSLAIDELPTLPRYDIDDSGSTARECAELRRVASRAGSASSLEELEGLALDFLLACIHPLKVAMFAYADLRAREFWFTNQRIDAKAALFPSGRLPFSAIHDSRETFELASVFSQNNVDLEPPNPILQDRAKRFGTGRMLVAGIHAGELVCFIHYLQPTREPFTPREQNLVGLLAEIVKLALLARF